MEHKNQKYSNFPSQKQALTIIVYTMVLTFISGLVAAELGFNKAQLMLIEVLIILPAFLFIVVKNFSIVQVFRLRPVNIKILLLSVFIGLALTVLTDEIDHIVQLIFPMPEIFSKAIEDTLSVSDTNDLITILSSAVFLAAVCEELLFRGFLQTSFEHSFDITKAIMLTSLLFAIVHFIPWWTIQLIFFATFLGVMAWKSNSVIPPIIAHFINNGTALLFNNLDESFVEWYFWKNHINPIILGLAGLTLIYGLQTFYRYCDETYEQKSNYPSN